MLRIDGDGIEFRHGERPGRRALEIDLEEADRMVAGFSAVYGRLRDASARRRA